MAETMAVFRRTKRTKKNNKKIPTESPFYIEYTIRNDYKKLIPEKIMGVTRKFSKLMFVVQWKKIEKPSIVEANYMNLAFPAMVIQYYESIIQWENKKND